MRSPSRVLTVLLLITTLPFLSLEAIYRWSLRRVGPLPHLPARGRVSRVQRAIWAAEEGGPLRVEPRWPWTVLARHPPPGATLERAVARRWVRDPQRAIPRAFQLLAVEVWLSQHASAEQLLELVRPAEPGAIGWGEAALIGAQQRERSLACHPDRAWRARHRVLRRLRDDGALSDSELSAADAESLEAGVQSPAASDVDCQEDP